MVNMQRRPEAVSGGSSDRYGKPGLQGGWHHRAHLPSPAPSTEPPGAAPWSPCCWASDPGQAWEGCGSLPGGSGR